MLVIVNMLKGANLKGGGGALLTSRHWCHMIFRNHKHFWLLSMLRFIVFILSDWLCSRVIGWSTDCAVLWLVGRVWDKVISGSCKILVFVAWRFCSAIRACWWEWVTRKEFTTSCLTWAANILFQYISRQMFWALY